MCLSYYFVCFFLFEKRRDFFLVGECFIHSQISLENFFFRRVLSALSGCCKQVGPRKPHGHLSRVMGLDGFTDMSRGMGLDGFAQELNRSASHTWAHERFSFRVVFGGELSHSFPTVPTSSCLRWLLLCRLRSSTSVSVTAVVFALLPLLFTLWPFFVFMLFQLPS